MTNDMQLPPGKTCIDCQHYHYCTRLFGCPDTNTSCDWSPSRFALRVDPEPARDDRTIDMFGALK